MLKEILWLFIIWATVIDLFSFPLWQCIPLLITQLSLCPTVLHLSVSSVSQPLSLSAHIWIFWHNVFFLMTVVLPPFIADKHSTTCLIPVPLELQPVRKIPIPVDTGSSLPHAAPSQRLTPQAPVCLGKEMIWQGWLNSQGQTVHPAHTCQYSRNAEFTVRDE